MTYVCKVCKDTHKMVFETDGRSVMCTNCPVPCNKCRANGNGPYCEQTPCSCECHKKTTRIAETTSTGKSWILETITPAPIDKLVLISDGRTTGIGFKNSKDENAFWRITATGTGCVPCLIQPHKWQHLPEP